MKKQSFIPGTEPPSFPELDELADEYVEARNARMSMLAEEIDKRDLLHVMMKEKGLNTYEYGDSVIEVTFSEKVRVRRAESNEKDKGEVEIDE